ncbi:hypothetical protein ATCC90586_004752 [Pythium insidiosum]|nr:hypothetical protein ATCC90586_004752 [Pythium insidiosum]
MEEDEHLDFQDQLVQCLGEDVVIFPHDNAESQFGDVRRALTSTQLDGYERIFVVHGYSNVVPSTGERTVLLFRLEQLHGSEQIAIAVKNTDPVDVACMQAFLATLQQRLSPGAPPARPQARAPRDTTAEFLEGSEVLPQLPDDDESDDEEENTGGASVSSKKAYPVYVRCVLQEANILHRDLKPSNILVTSTCDLKKLLVYDPKKRLTAEQALRHPYMREAFRLANSDRELHSTDWYDADDEEEDLFRGVIDDSHERVIEDREAMQKAVFDQICHFHPEAREYEELQSRHDQKFQVDPNTGKLVPVSV